MIIYNYYFCRESLREYGPGMAMIPPPFGMMDRRPPWMMHGGDMPPHGGPMPHVPRLVLQESICSSINS